MPRNSICGRKIALHGKDVAYKDPGATLDDLREALTTLEDSERIARRVLGGAHPTTSSAENSLFLARAALRARETLPTGSAWLSGFYETIK